jgi:hypothetical protein
VTSGHRVSGNGKTNGRGAKREKARSRDRRFGTSESGCRQNEFSERREAKERVNANFPRSRESGKKAFDVGTRERRDSEALPQVGDSGKARVEKTVGYEFPIRKGRVLTLRVGNL